MVAIFQGILASAEAQGGHETPDSVHRVQIAKLALGMLEALDSSDPGLAASRARDLCEAVAIMLASES